MKHGSLTAPHPARLLPVLRAAAVVLVLAAGLGIPETAAAADAKYRNQLSSATRHLMRGNYDDAARVFGEILKQHPNDEKASSGFAQALIALDRLDEADAFLEEALARVEPKTDLYRRREELRRLQGRTEDAFSDALAVMASSDGMAPWVYRETRELIGEGLDASRAGAIAERALAERPDDVNFVVLAAVILALDDRFVEGSELLTRIDTQKKQNGAYVMRYGEELAALGYPAAAVDAMMLAAELADAPPRRSQYLFRAADLLEADGRYADALAQLQRIATEREGTSAAGKALTRSAALYQQHLDDPAGALAVYERLRNDPSLGHNRPEMLLHMGDCYTRLGRFDDAARTYNEVLPEALDPEHAESAAYRAAEVAFFRGDADSALTLYQTMAETYMRSLLTDDAASRYILLNSYAKVDGGAAMGLYGRMEWGRAAGDSAAADSTARLIIERYPDMEIAAEAWLALADISAAAGRPVEAVERLDRVVRDFPGNRRAAVALKRQGDLYSLELNDPERALEKYESMLAEYPESVLGAEVRSRVRALRGGLKS